MLTAYTDQGQEIPLPRTGRILLRAGTIVQRGQNFETLERDRILVRRREHDSLCQATELVEELR